MQIKSLAFLLFSATALATSGPAQEQKRDIVDKITSVVGSIPSDIVDGFKSLSDLIPPSNIASVLQTAIPSDVRDSIKSDPAAAFSFNSQLHSSLKNGQTPSWYAALPTDVKSYLDKIGNIDEATTGAQPTGTSRPTGNTASGATASATRPAQTSPNGAPRPTGALAASFAGVAGLLGLAIVL